MGSDPINRVRPHYRPVRHDRFDAGLWTIEDDLLIRPDKLPFLEVSVF